MCGLAGEIACGPNARTDADRALPMLHAILHRGPNGVGLWESETGAACLLHTRLSLVDLDNGHQPMSDVSGQVVIAYNGEFYGFERAREELEARGAVFQTRCDTEVLLQLYLHHGPDFVRDLEGEFAFVLFDRRSGQTMLARDRFGVKPLFIAERNGVLLFGSEAKALLAHPQVERQLDPKILKRRLQGVFLPQDSLFAGIRAIEPGTYMLASRERITTQRYADLDAAAVGTLRLNFEDATDALEQSLAEAVKRRFHGDAPVGLFLSGGVDSSCIAALAGSTKEQQRSAFSINFAGTWDSECDAAAAVAQQSSLRHVSCAMDADDLSGSFARSLWHAETIAPDTHGTAKMLLASRARHDVTAVLTGEGADERHGGYAYFEHATLIAAAAEGQDRGRLGRFVAEHGARDGVLGAITPKLRRRLAWSSSGGTPYMAMRAVVAGRGMRLMTTAAFRSQATERPEQALLDWLTQRAPDARELDDASLSRFVSTQTDLPAYNLSSLGDRIEMANGLEARLPFLDRAVVNLLWSMPVAFHLENGVTKRVLRAVLARHLPAAARKPKRAFLTPAAIAAGLLKSPLARRWLSVDATRRAGIFEPLAVTAARGLVGVSQGAPSAAFYLSTYLTMALSTHLIISMFCERFDETLTAHAPISLDALRRRLRGEAATLRAVA